MVTLNPKTWLYNFSFFRKDGPEPEERKSYDGYGDSYSGESFPEYLLNSGHGDLSAYAATVLYKRCMPLFNAVNMRAEAFAQIPIKVEDKRTNEIVEDHPILELFESPNSDVSQQEFLQQVASYYDITGDSFIVSTGRLDREPLELATVGPQSVNFSNGSNPRFGILNIPRDIRVQQQNQGALVFAANESQKFKLRYLNEREDAEIWHIRDFNPFRSGNNFRGLSKAHPVWMEIQQYISGNTTNLSNLKRGSRLSLAWVNLSDVPLTKVQYQRAKEQAQKYEGDYNSGGTTILDGLDVKPIQQTNRDMEFSQLQDSMLSRISSIYRVPLALLLPQTMTLNNLQTSMFQFFDNGVLPLTSRLYNELTRMLMPRYKGSENLQLTYIENDISALRSRILESAKKLSEIDVNTIDEIRQLIGYKELPEGGDSVYRSVGLVPVDENFDSANDDDLTTDDF